MGTEVFNFPIVYGSQAETQQMRREITTAQSGLSYVRGYGPNLFTANFQIIFTESGAQSVQAFEQFIRETLLNGTDSFLYQAQAPAYREVMDETLGVSSGGAGLEFLLARRFINAASLAITVDSNPETNWTLQDNNTAPKIVTTAGFAAGQVRASYLYRYQVILANDPLALQQLVRGVDLATPGSHRIPIAIREQKAGASFA